MSTKKKGNNADDKSVENIENVLSKSEQFIEKNQKILLYIVAGLLIIVSAYWAYLKFYKSPRENDAVAQMFVAQRSFEKDSFNLALNGNVNYPGFLGIIEDYSGTKAANLANFYAGVCYLNLGNYDQAIDYLMDFSTDDIILASEKYGAIGDSYVQKDMIDQAIKYYKKAVDDDYSNDFTTPIYLKKLALAYEHQGNYQEAFNAYEKIYKEHPQSQEAKTIQKYMERAKMHIE